MSRKSNFETKTPCLTHEQIANVSYWSNFARSPARKRISKLLVHRLRHSIFYYERKNDVLTLVRCFFRTIARLLDSRVYYIIYWSDGVHKLLKVRKSIKLEEQSTLELFEGTIEGLVDSEFVEEIKVKKSCMELDSRRCDNEFEI